MEITAQHEEVEARFRRLVAEAELPEPDSVQYEPESVGFYWHEPKVAVFVDFNDPLDSIDVGAVSRRPEGPA